jgi:molybdenum cofactor cytidylyltransferase
MIAALILAAGQSKRMGKAKMLLPWGTNTVLGQVIEAFQTARVDEIVVVTGGDGAEVERIAEACRARSVFNDAYATQEMLSSVQAGIRAMAADIDALFVALGDQPQIQAQTIEKIAQRYAETRAALIVPSYQMRRGHPWLVSRGRWDEILRLRCPQTPRDFLNDNADKISYVMVDTPTILQDIDTPEDYLKSLG